MMVQMDEGLWNALLELDTLMQEKKSLVSQLEELTLSRYDYPDKLLNYHLKWFCPTKICIACVFM